MTSLKNATLSLGIGLTLLATAALGQQDHSAHSGHSMTDKSEPPAMEHGDMQMQGGEPPANARDPHTYSGGFTLTEGPYALSGQQLLVLADEHIFWSVIGDRFEYASKGEILEYDLQGWVGTTFNRLVIKAEGELSKGDWEESQTEFLWSRAHTAYFDAQIGVRLDVYDDGENREWLAAGLQGLAPYWFELDVTAYLGSGGRTALALEAEYELLLSQRWVLQPRAELTIYGKDDVENHLGSGLSSSAVGLRLRYEVSRQFAPYVGIEWRNQYGKTEEFAEIGNEKADSTRYVAGIRFWF